VALTQLAQRTSLELVHVRLDAMPARVRATWRNVASVEQSGLHLVAFDDDSQLWEVDLAREQPR
jgi:hypothetical protein